MNFKIISCVCLTIVLQLSCFNNLVNGQTDWVWGKNRITGQNGQNSPQSGNNNNNNGGQSGSGLVPVNTVNIFGSGGNSNVGSNSGSGFGNGGDRDFPILPSQQQQLQQATVVQVLQPGSTTGGSNSNGGGSASTNSALPSNSIRAVEGEPRLFTRQIRRFVQNAVNNLSGNGNANSATSSTSANNLIPGTLLGALLALGPAFIGNRYPNLPSTGNGGSSSGSSFKPNNRPTNRPNRPNTDSSSNSGRVCACVSDDQCRLPSIVMGSCGGGVMCCKSSGVRIIGDDNRNGDRNRDRDSTASNSRVQAAEIRAGLFREVVRGTSNVIDDALDLILAPFLTQDDQQKLASRLGTNTASRKN